MNTIRVSFDADPGPRCIREGTRPWSLCRRRPSRWLPPVDVALEKPDELPLENLCSACECRLLEHMQDPVHFIA